MTLTAKDVEEITRLLEESSFDELYLELEGVKLSLRRGGAVAPTSLDQRTARSLAPDREASPAGAGPAQVAPPRAPDRAVEQDSGHQAVNAPLLGTFYRSPKPGAPPFVEVGSLVQEETIVGIIEVMKLMNTVRAGVNGRVVEILAHDGALVEYGETLLRIAGAGSA